MNVEVERVSTNEVLAADELWRGVADYHNGVWTDVQDNQFHYENGRILALHGLRAGGSGSDARIALRRAILAGNWRRYGDRAGA